MRLSHMLLGSCLVAALSLGTAGCSDDSSSETPAAAVANKPQSRQSDAAPMATVGQVTITKADFARTYAPVKRRLANVTPSEGITLAHIRRRAREMVVSSLIEAEWVEQEAERQGVKGPSGARRDFERNDALSITLSNRAEGARPLQPSRQDVERYYRANRADLGPLTRELRKDIVDILFQARKQANKNLFSRRLHEDYQAETKCAPSFDSSLC